MRFRPDPTFYHKLGLSILRQAWFNLDRIWALALIGAGVVAILL